MPIFFLLYIFSPVDVAILSTGHSVELDSGVDISFNCQVVGLPAPTITWFKDGELILTSQTNFGIETMVVEQGISRAVNISSILHVTDISVDDTGLYSCRASNSFSSAVLNPPYSLSVLTSACLVDPCRNGAKCVPMGMCSHCECLEGFTGPTCEIGEISCASPLHCIHLTIIFSSCHRS